MTLRLLIAAAIAWGAWNWWDGRGIAHPPGVLAADAPRQVDLGPAAAPFAVSGHRLTPLARFEVTARVLGVERYRFDRAAALSDTDLALGWGRMSDSAVLASISISQSGRFYFWRASSFPIPREEIEASSANMHLIAADPGVAAALRRIRVGDVVTLRGYLVEAVGSDGWRWRSSLSRTDTGDGACEIVFVQAVERR